MRKLLFCLTVPVFVLTLAAFAEGATLTVTKTADTNDGVCDADCSLREAVAAAASGDTIAFASPLFDTAQTLQVNGQITLNKNLFIYGRGASLTTIQNIAAASATSRVFLVTGGTTVNLNGVTITGGNLTLGGGGISGCSQACGAGIGNNGNLTLTNSTVSRNTAGGNGTGAGAGIINIGGTLTLTNSTVSNNSVSGGSISQGGGIFNINGTLTLTNSTVSNNSASNSSNFGGGIYNEGTVNLTNSTVSNNSAGGGLTNQGGGISNFGTVNARNTIISGNSAATSGANLQGSLSAASENNIVDNEANVRLAPLGFYGGATNTHALLSGSTAINAGNNCVTNQTCATFNAPVALSADQRGAARVGSVDIGAFEVNNSANGGSYRAVLPSGVKNAAYAYTLVPSSGAFSYTLTGGALPANVSLTTAFAPQAVVSLAGTPTQAGFFNFTVTATSGANSVATDYQLFVNLATAAGVSVSGRVLTGKSGLRNAIVTLTDSNGNVRTAKTGTFGYYRFDDVAAGQTVVVSVVSKRFQFTPQVVDLTDSLADLDFNASPE